MIRGWGPRPVQQELALCQRYYEKSQDVDTVPTTANNVVGMSACYCGGSVGNLGVVGFRIWKVTKRVDPTVTIRPYTTPTNTNRVSDGGGPTDQGASSGVAIHIGQYGCNVQNQSGGTLTMTNNISLFHYEADSEL